MTDEMLSDSDEIIDEGKLIFHSVENWKIHFHRKNISWNQLFSNFFSENVDLTEIGERGAAWE